jgi:hypothetical protein
MDPPEVTALSIRANFEIYRRETDDNVKEVMAEGIDMALYLLHLQEKERKKKEQEALELKQKKNKERTDRKREREQDKKSPSKLEPPPAKKQKTQEVSGADAVAATATKGKESHVASNDKGATDKKNQTSANAAVKKKTTTTTTTKVTKPAKKPADKAADGQSKDSPSVADKDNNVVVDSPSGFETNKPREEAPTTLPSNGGQGGIVQAPDSMVLDAMLEAATSLPLPLAGATTPTEQQPTQSERAQDSVVPLAVSSPIVIPDIPVMDVDGTPVRTVDANANPIPAENQQLPPPPQHDDNDDKEDEHSSHVAVGLIANSSSFQVKSAKEWIAQFGQVDVKKQIFLVERKDGRGYMRCAITDIYAAPLDTIAVISRNGRTVRGMKMLLSVLRPLILLPLAEPDGRTQYTIEQLKWRNVDWSKCDIHVVSGSPYTGELLRHRATQYYGTIHAARYTGQVITLKLKQMVTLVPRQEWPTTGPVATP